MRKLPHELAHRLLRAALGRVQLGFHDHEERLLALTQLLLGLQL